MPVLHHYQNRAGGYVKAWINGSIVTLQLSDKGFERLQESGVHDGKKFRLNWLIDLIHNRDAFTREGETSIKAGRHEAEQFVFDFAEDESAQKALPVCEQTGTFEDLHLVVHGEDHMAHLLGPEARKYVRKVSLSVPLSLMTAADLGRLIAADKLSADAASVARLRKFFSRKRAEHWERLMADNEKQANLELPGDEFRLQ